MTPSACAACVQKENLRQNSAPGGDEISYCADYGERTGYPLTPGPRYKSLPWWAPPARYGGGQDDLSGEAGRQRLRREATDDARPSSFYRLI